MLLLLVLSANGQDEGVGCTIGDCEAVRSNLIVHVLHYHLVTFDPSFIFHFLPRKSF